MEYNIFNERIKKIIDGIEKDEMKCYGAWRKYLNKKLQFPFEAEVFEYQGSESFIQAGEKCRVIKIYREEDLYGIIVEIKFNNQKKYFPLCDLEALNLDDLANQALKDYQVWFANR